MLCAFCGEASDHLLKRVHQASSFVGDDRLFLTHCGSGKNSADLGLCFQAGELTSVLPLSVHFIVISNDQDFRYATLSILTRCSSSSDSRECAHRQLMPSLKMVRPRSYQSVPNSLDAAPDFHSMMRAAAREIDQTNEVPLESGEALSLLFDEGSSASPYLKLRSLRSPYLTPSRTHLTPYRRPIAHDRAQTQEPSTPRPPFVFGSPSPSPSTSAPRTPFVFGSSLTSSSSPTTTGMGSP
jgi:hypothetical protein